MNEFATRRIAKAEMFTAAMRMHPVLFQATQLTKEKLDFGFIREEFMRVNGFRQMPLVAHNIERMNMQNSHWNSLVGCTAWATSGRAYGVRYQTPVTQRYSALGRLAESVPIIRNTVTCQHIFLEHMSRVEGITLIEGAEQGEGGV